MLTTGLTSAFFKFPTNAMNPKKSTTSPVLLITCAIKGDRHGALFYLRREFTSFPKKKVFSRPSFPW
jgi:hypothetical protein